MGWRPQPGPRCPACNKPVYQVEQIIVRDRQPYHHWCIRCVNCTISLTSRNLYEKNRQLFCNNCYQSLFNPQYFINPSTNPGGFVQPDRNRHLEMYERAAGQGGRHPSGGYDQSDAANMRGHPGQGQYPNSPQGRYGGYPGGYGAQSSEDGGASGASGGQGPGFSMSNGLDICTLTTIAPQGSYAY